MIWFDNGFRGFGGLFIFCSFYNVVYNIDRFEIVCLKFWFWWEKLELEIV